MASNSYDKELDALKTILKTLEDLDETQKTFVLKTAAERLNVTSIIVTKSPENNTYFESQSSQTPGTLSPKTFLKQKQPATAVEQLVCLAYYLTNYRNQPTFKTIELTKLNHEAGGPRISNPAAFVRNAVSQNNYLAPTGGGQKRLTNHGEQVIEALPDREKVKAILSSQKKPGKRKSKSSK